MLKELILGMNEKIRKLKRHPLTMWYVSLGMNLAISLRTALTGTVAQATAVTNNEVTNPAFVNKYCQQHQPLESTSQ